MPDYPRLLSHADLLQLKRWNTSTIYNGWEQITKLNAGADAFNIDEIRDFMPQMGPMVAYAFTHICIPCAGIARWRSSAAKSAPGELIHADKHGFLLIPPEDQPLVLEAARFMDANECDTVIPAARDCSGRSTDELLANLEGSITQFSANVRAWFSREGKW